MCVCVCVCVRGVRGQKGKTESERERERERGGMGGGSEVMVCARHTQKIMDCKFAYFHCQRVNVHHFVT